VRSSQRPLVTMIHAKRGRRGPPRTLLALAEYLSPDWDVLVAAPDGFLLDRLRAQAPAVEAFPLPVSGRPFESWVRRSAALIQRLRREDRPVLIHANGLSALNVAGPVARSFDAPVLVHFHAFEVLPRSRLFVALWSRIGVRMSFFPVSDYSRGLLEATTARRWVEGVLPNPIDCSAYAVRRNGVRRPFRVGFVGGRSARKGLHLLIEIADLLRHEALEWHLYGIDTAKPTEHLEACRTEIRRRGLEGVISWEGKFDDARAAYSDVDALLIASSQESFCRVAVEATASGLPVVATRIPGLSEVIWDGVSGLLFDPRRPEQGADCLRRVASDSDLRTRLRAGATKAAARFDISTVGEQLSSAYEAMLSKASREP